MSKYYVRSGDYSWPIDADTVTLGDDNVLKFYKKLPDNLEVMEVIAVFRAWDNFEKVEG